MEEKAVDVYCIASLLCEEMMTEMNQFATKIGLTEADKSCLTAESPVENFKKILTISNARKGIKTVKIVADVTKTMGFQGIYDKLDEIGLQNMIRFNASSINVEDTSKGAVEGSRKAEDLSNLNEVQNKEESHSECTDTLKESVTIQPNVQNNIDDENDSDAHGEEDKNYDGEEYAEQPFKETQENTKGKKRKTTGVHPCNGQHLHMFTILSVTMCVTMYFIFACFADTTVTIHTKHNRHNEEMAALAYQERLTLQGSIKKLLDYIGRCHGDLLQCEKVKGQLEELKTRAENSRSEMIKKNEQQRLQISELIEKLNSQNVSSKKITEENEKQIKDLAEKLDAQVALNNEIMHSKEKLWADFKARKENEEVTRNRLISLNIEKATQKYTITTLQDRLKGAEDRNNILEEHNNYLRREVGELSSSRSWFFGLFAVAVLFIILCICSNPGKG